MLKKIICTLLVFTILCQTVLNQEVKAMDDQKIIKNESELYSEGLSSEENYTPLIPLNGDLSQEPYYDNLQIYSSTMCFNKNDIGYNIFDKNLAKYVEDNKSKLLDNCVNLILTKEGSCLRRFWKKPWKIGLEKIYKKNGFSDKHSLSTKNDIKKLILYAEKNLSDEDTEIFVEQLFNFRLALITDLVPDIFSLDTIMDTFAACGIQKEDEKQNKDFALLINIYPLTREEIDGEV